MLVMLLDDSRIQTVAEIDTATIVDPGTAVIVTVVFAEPAPLFNVAPVKVMT